MTPVVTASPRPKISLVAAIVAFLMAGLSALSAIIGPIMVLPAAFVFLLGGIGILRRHVWSAYGLGLFLYAQLILYPVVLMRAPSVAMKVALGVSTAFTVIISVLFFFAGRSLGRAGFPRGQPVLWIVLSLMLILPFMFLEPFANRSGSMEDALLIGDRVMVQIFPGPRPSRGQLMVFHYPVDRSQTFIKRIVGVPGDRIRTLDQVVYRNGIALQEPYVHHKAGYPDSYRDTFPAVRLAPCCFPPPNRCSKRTS